MYTKEQMRRLAERDDTRVYDYENTVIFEPYSIEKVTECVDRVLKLMEDPSTVHEKVKEDAQLKEFSETHQVIYKSLTDPNFIAVPKNVESGYKIIALKAQMDKGKISEDSARTKCCSIALEASMKKNDA